MSKVWIVYFVKYEGEVVYIGSGVEGRESHATSGISHVYELNKLHFHNKSVDVTIVSKHKSKDDSLKEEKLNIVTYRPKYNKVHNNTDVTDNMSKYAKFKADSLKWISSTSKYHKQTDKYRSIVDGLFKVFGAKTLYDGVCIYGMSKNKYTRGLTECCFKSKSSSVWGYLLNLVEISVKDGKPWLRVRTQDEICTVVVEKQNSRWATY